MIRTVIYRAVMRFAHWFNWHYMPPTYPDGDTMLWCKWCGVRDVVKRHNVSPCGDSAKANAALAMDSRRQSE